MSLNESFNQFKNHIIIIVGIILFVSIDSSILVGQTVNVGSGSYSTVLPSGEIGPQTFFGSNAIPKISDGFDQPIQSNDFWSSLIYPFFGDAHSNILYAHPLNFKASSTGLEFGYTTDHVFVADDFLYPYSHHFTVGVAGLSASQTLTHHYGDWTVTALWEDAEQSMEATFGHGLPFAYFNINGGSASIACEESPAIWYEENEVLGITILGKHYGIFAPTGSSWSGTNNLVSTLNGQDYLSVALLPDTEFETLELFRSHAYAFVTNSIVTWEYDENISQLSSTYSYETTLMDSAEGNVNETLSALYRHQWLHSSAALTEHTYHSPRGEMRLHNGNTFETVMKFSGILPALPDRGDYNPSELLQFVEDAAAETIPVGPTYENGKLMARFAHLVHIADQLGAITERDHFLSQIKHRLEDWFTVGGNKSILTLIIGMP